MKSPSIRVIPVAVRGLVKLASVGIGWVGVVEPAAGAVGRTGLALRGLSRDRLWIPPRSGKGPGMPGSPKARGPLEPGGTSAWLDLLRWPRPRS